MRKMRIPQLHGIIIWWYSKKGAAAWLLIARISAAAAAGSLIGSSVQAQSRQASAQNEYWAYIQASEIKQPDLKIQALEKYLRDFPQGASVSKAHQALFDTLVK